MAFLARCWTLGLPENYLGASVSWCAIPPCQAGRWDLDSSRTAPGLQDGILTAFPCFCPRPALAWDPCTTPLSPWVPVHGQLGHLPSCILHLEQASCASEPRNRGSPRAPTSDIMGLRREDRPSTIETVDHRTTFCWPAADPEGTQTWCAYCIVPPVALSVRKRCERHLPFAVERLRHERPRRIAFRHFSPSSVRHLRLAARDEPSAPASTKEYRTVTSPLPSHFASVCFHPPTARHPTYWIPLSFLEISRVLPFLDFPVFEPPTPSPLSFLLPELLLQPRVLDTARHVHESGLIPLPNSIFFVFVRDVERQPKPLHAMFTSISA